jgi:flagellar basal-body rod modification protein FlgD
MIGNQVRATSDTVRYDGTTNVTLGYTLDSTAEAVTIKIYDDSGNLVRTITKAPTEKGDNTITWDGKNKDGVQLDAGEYTFSVSASDSKGASITTSTFITGTVSSVRFKSDGGYFVIDGIEIPLANVLEIKKG